MKFSIFSWIFLCFSIVGFLQICQCASVEQKYTENEIPEEKPKVFLLEAVPHRANSKPDPRVHYEQKEDGRMVARMDIDLGIHGVHADAEDDED